MPCLQMPHLQTGVSQMVITVASGLLLFEQCFFLKKKISVAGEEGLYCICGCVRAYEVRVQRRDSELS